MTETTVGAPLLALFEKGPAAAAACPTHRALCDLKSFTGNVIVEGERGYELSPTNSDCTPERDRECIRTISSPTSTALTSITTRM